MNRLLFIALFLSFVGPSFAIDDAAEERAATGSNGLGHQGMRLGKIALLSADKGNASILGDGYFLGNFSYSQANFANALAPAPPAVSSGELGPTGRVVLKLLGGTAAGIGAATAIIFISLENWCGEDWCSEDRYEDDRLGEGVILSLIPIGIAVGVSAFDQHDRPIYPLAASLLGFGIGVALENWGIAMFLPVIAATVASEWSRERPESRRYSIGLRPEPGGGLSAVAALRFQ